MAKFDRIYQMSVQSKLSGKTLTIKRPFTIEFDIHRNSFSSASAAQFRIYNLNPDHRAQLRKDANTEFPGDQRVMEFQAGYGANLAIGYKGFVSQAWSVREGNNIVTQIESFDSGFAYLNAVLDETFPGSKGGIGGVTNKSIVEALADSFKPIGIQKGAIGDVPGAPTRATTISGPTVDGLKSIVGENGFFFDNNTIHVLKDDECIAGEVTIINSAAGLLGTPLIENRVVHLDMLFEPRLKIGQVIRLETTTADKGYNTFYKIVGLHHRGTISDAVCGDAVTTVQMIASISFKVIGIN